MRLIRKALIEDAIELSKHLRKEDLEEIKAGTDEDPMKVLIEGILISNPAFSFFSPKGKLGGIFGVVPSENPRCGRVWLLGTKEIERYPLLFIKHSKKILKELYKTYDILENFVHENNALHIKWLRYMGFQFTSKVQINNSFFWHFYRRDG